MSPCTKICKINSEGYCIGCKRSLEEIKNWIRYSDLDKKKIIETLKTRRIHEKELARGGR